MIGNLTIREDAGQQFVSLSGITAGIGENQLLTITANSSNKSLILNPTVTYSAPGPTGSLNFTPIANIFGSATIIVTVSDGQPANSTVSQSFIVMVDAVNDAPSFVKGADQVVDAGAVPRTVAGWATGISAGPGEEASQGVAFIVTNDMNSLFAEQPSIAVDGTLSYTPAADAHGVATVTVTLQDDGGTANGGVDTSDARPSRSR